MADSEDTTDTTIADPPVNTGAPTARLSGADLTATLTAVAPVERYHGERVIGRGGQGEVVAAIDAQIGREVAIKRLYGQVSEGGVQRFLREARIQGRLEHPAIVPVYELACAADGSPYFAMKRLAGTTLADILEAIHDGDAEVGARFGRQRLLRAFADVCLAIEFAHSRGVIHRDLKPANIMLGDFGEVYVLDWGIARVVDGPDDLRELAPATDIGLTQAGAILGTPGYMAPEQAGGLALDHRTDVFALGAILFEILSGSPLLARTIAASMVAVDARPSQRAPDAGIPPELDAACVAATIADPERRLSSARELGDRVQRWLDGDRDLEMRRRLASSHLADARAALATGGDAGRGAAMQHASRALAFDPSSDAAALVGRLMLEPPPVPPPEVLAEADRFDAERSRRLIRVAVDGTLAYLLFIPVLYWIGVRDAAYIALLAGATVVDAVLIFASLRFGERRGLVLAATVFNAVLIGVLSRMLSPFVIGPTIAVISAMAFAAHPALGRRRWIWAVMLAGVLVPWLLELVGVLSRTIAESGGNLVVTPPVVVVQLPHVELGLALFTTIAVIVGGRFMRTVTQAEWEWRCRIQLHAWHLRQLVPVA